MVVFFAYFMLMDRFSAPSDGVCNHEAYIVFAFDNKGAVAVRMEKAYSGQSIVQYTGTGGVQTIGHGLSSAPKMMLVKNTETTDVWRVC